MPTQTSSLIRAAQAASIFLTAFSSGANLALSFLLIPRLLESPTPLMVRQWLRTYNITKKLFPALMHPAGAAFYFLAWTFRGADPGALVSRSRLYLAAGLLCSGMGPYTLVAVMPTNRKIQRKVEETKDMALTQETVGADGSRDESAKWLVDHWGMLNLPRGILLGVGGVLGLTATMWW